MKQVTYVVRSIEGEMLNDFEDEANARKFRSRSEACTASRSLGGIASHAKF